MALKINYSKALKANVLRELYDGASTDSLSSKYGVPDVVIKNWKEMEAAEEYISTVFTQSEITNGNVFVRIKASWHNIRGYIRKRALLSGLLIGVVSVVVVAFLCYNKTEFYKQNDPRTEIAHKLDSLVLSSHRIEGMLQKQLEGTGDLRNEIFVASSQQQKIINILDKIQKSQTSYKDKFCDCSRIATDSLTVVK